MEFCINVVLFLQCHRSIKAKSIQFITASLQLPRHQEGQDRPLVQRTSERRLANLWQLLLKAL